MTEGGLICLWTCATQSPITEKYKWVGSIHSLGWVGLGSVESVIFTA